MFLPYRRHGIVVALALVTGFTGLIVQHRSLSVPLPSIAELTRGTGWRVAFTYQAGGWPGYAYGQWRLHKAQGNDAVLYLGATAQVQTMVHWTGELAYAGAGYQVADRGFERVQLRDGTTASFSIVTVQRLGDRQILDYAIIGPDGIAAHATDNPLRTAWDTLRGDSGPYYLVRLSMPGRLGNQAAHAAARAAATQLLAPILSALKARDNSGFS